MLILVPKDPLGRGPDPHFAPEWEAATALGLPVALIDDEALRAGDAAGAVRAVPSDADVVYRGWMLKSAQYAALEQALAGRGARLRTSSAQYQRAHELPGWYQLFARHSAETQVVAPDPEGDELAAALAAFGSGGCVLKDHVKSEKHHWAEAALVPDVEDVEQARAVARRFLELRGPDLEGGLVLRRFEEYTGHEARSWWLDGQLAFVSAHPDTPSEEHESHEVPASEIAPEVQALGCPFVTVDLVKRASGGWRVVEVGDGQVSDRPSSLPAERLVAALRSARA